MAFVMGLFMASCSDSDDASISMTPLLTDSSVTTGSADVTATSATFHGTVKGLEGQSASAYALGFYYGSSENNLSEKVSATGSSEFEASITGMPGNVVYYQAFVTLQGRMTYKGGVQSAVLTNAKAITGDAKDLTANTVILTGKLSEAPTTGAVSGIVISGVEGTENVRSGVRIQAEGINNDYEIKAQGLLPNTTYHYTAYLDLGNGTVYGEDRTFTTPASDFNPDTDLVDLGLSTKWARYNVGASKETELGGLFGFGDMTGFQTSIELDNYASADIYKTDRDVANKVYGSWVTMPTIDEFEELFSECKQEWVEQEGVSGYKLTGPNGNSIFLPAAGTRTQANISGDGTNGYYLSGSINPSDAQFAMAYSFDQNSSRRTTTPVYQALAVRPVSVAKNVKFDKSKLIGKTWEIDLRTDGSHYKFDGPVYFYGTDDSWATVTNNQPVVGNSWCWAADYAGNSWVVGGDAKNCQGTMTFNGDGTVTVHQYIAGADGADGTYQDANGTYTIDEKNKTVKLSIQPLIPANFIGGIAETKNVDLRILSLTDEALQIGITRASDGQFESINYVNNELKNGFTAKLTCYGDVQNPNGDASTDEWNSATVNVLGGNAGVKSYKVTFNTNYPRTNGKVYILDIVGYHNAYPNSLVRIDSIKADGKEVKFDANKFYYGDLEGNGNYRVEMANIWGCGHNDGWNGLADTPFHKDGGETTNETALAFNSTFEVVFTVVSITSDGTGVYTPNLITINPSWGGTWGYNEGKTMEVVNNGGKYSIKNGEFDITYKSGDHADGSIMTFLEIADLYGFFPGTHATLDELLLDGKGVNYNKAMVLDANESPKYRLELWNCYGATKNAGCAFGTPDGDVMKGLAFKQSIETKFTIHNLFAVPEW